MEVQVRFLGVLDIWGRGGRPSVQGVPEKSTFLVFHTFLWDTVYAVNPNILTSVGHAVEDHALMRFRYPHMCAYIFQNPHKFEFDICSLCAYGHMTA